MNALQQWINELPSWAFLIGAVIIAVIVQRVFVSRGGGSDSGADASHVINNQDIGGDSGND